MDTSVQAKTPPERWGMYNNDGTWTYIPLERLTDRHLVNAIYHVTLYRRFFYNYQLTLAMLDREVARRQLTPEFLGGGPYPYHDQQGVRWEWEPTCAMHMERPDLPRGEPEYDPKFLQSLETTDQEVTYEATR